MRLTSLTLAVAGLAAALVSTTALAQKKYDTGATDKEIKIGGISPYSGPASAYGAIGKAISAYLAKVNDEGGINGRKVTVISLDDALQPPRTVEQVRRLVEQDEVDAIVNQVGTATASSVRRYLNDKKVP